MLGPLWVVLVVAVGWMRWGSKDRATSAPLPISLRLRSFSRGQTRPAPEPRAAQRTDMVPCNIDSHGLCETRAERQQRSGRAAHHGLVRRTDDAVISAFDLRQSDPTRLGYGYVLARASWGQGLMTEALAEVVDWALRQSSVWRIGDVENLASARVMEKRA